MLKVVFIFLLVSEIHGIKKTFIKEIDEKTLIEKLEWSLFVNDNNDKLVAFLQRKSDNFPQDCYISGDGLQIKNILRLEPEAKVSYLTGDVMTNLIEICTYGKTNNIFKGNVGDDVAQDLGIYSGLFIYPGTKWCGAGNISESYDDLGPEVEADMCCRTHDHCNDSIEAFNSKYGLQNRSPYTKSHCDCDELFYYCLQKANTKASNRIGRIFFNALRMECFKENFPIIGCKKYRGWVRRRCEEYEFDYEAELIYQFFEPKHYESLSTEDDGDDEEDENEIGDVFSHMLKLEKTYESQNKNEIL